MQPQPIRIHPKYAMILKYDLRPGTQQGYYHFVTREMLPALHKRKVYMQNDWVVVYGSVPERHLEFITEQLETLRVLLEDDAWERLETKLKSYAKNYSRRIVRYTDFKI